jgi:tetratricopeptide (TPR) repeat protein
MRHVAEERQPDKLVAIGEAYAAVGDSVRAAQYFSLAIDSNGNEQTIFPRLLEMCIRDRQFRAALFYVENYLRRHPNDARLHFLAGSLHAGMGQPKEARARYEESLRKDPANSEVHYALAVLSRDHEGNPAEADTRFREYLKLEPRGAHADEARGGLLRVVP